MGLLDSRSYSAGHFLFRLDTNIDGGAAYLKSVAGGMVKGAVLEEQAGAAATQFKHLGAVEIDPIQLEIGMAMSWPVLDWIKSSWEKKFTRHSGSIIHADSNMKCRFEQWFFHALITETRFPTLDGGAREPAYLGVTIQPEYVQRLPGDGRKMRGNFSSNQKLWLPSNFRMWIAGVDCSMVSRIDSFTVSQKVKPLYVGVDRFAEVEPTGVDFSNVSIYIACSHALGFEAWYEQCIVRGGAFGAERPGFIEFLGPANEILFTVMLNELGIHRMSIEKSEANVEQIKRYKVELYMESMELVWNPKYIR